MDFRNVFPDSLNKAIIIMMTCSVGIVVLAGVVRILFGSRR